MLLAIAPAGLSGTIGRATSASPSALPSATGGTSGSNIHIVSRCVVIQLIAEPELIFVSWCTALRMVPRLAHVHQACVETQCGWSSSLNDLCPSRRLELVGAGGQLGSMAAWEHYDGISHSGWSASAN